MTRRVLKKIALWLYAAFVLVPVAVLVVTSLSGPAAGSTLFPRHVTFRSYVEAFTKIPLLRHISNSVIVGISSTLIAVAVSILAAYAVTRFTFRGRNIFRGTILATQMLPGILFLLPLLLIYLNITRVTGFPLYGTLIGLIITYLTFALPFCVWMMSSFFATLPIEIDEAGRIDGLGRMGVLWYLVLPLTRPGIAAVGVYAFLTAWGEVLFAAVMTTPNTRTVGIALQSYATQMAVRWDQVTAAAIVITIPVIAAFLFVQRQFIAGLASGAVKG